MVEVAGARVAAPARAMRVLELGTPFGPARAHVEAVAKPRAALVLGHGAGGGVDARDLIAVKQAAISQDLTVVLVEQPYRVAGRRSPPAGRQLDAAWAAVIEQLRVKAVPALELIAGGRSSGARVACRTAGAVGARAVLCLAFPLQPTRRRKDGSPAPSRLDELDAVGVPVLVVQGESDPFGMPPPAPRRQVVALRGNHALRSDLDGLRSAVAGWLQALLS